MNALKHFKDLNILNRKMNEDLINGNVRIFTVKEISIIVPSKIF